MCDSKNIVQLLGVKKFGTTAKCLQPIFRKIVKLVEVQVNGVSE